MNDGKYTQGSVTGRVSQAGPEIQRIRIVDGHAGAAPIQFTTPDVSIAELRLSFGVDQVEKVADGYHRMVAMDSLSRGADPEQPECEPVKKNKPKGPTKHGQWWKR